ncbi:MAG: hypothetical protein A4S09_02305 [Proteobacteria bacterium SG_bin7]|nr:MAG: hypothetical protein A4S09_02305 [Proteobacteria bacterium SG_bin7]
MLTSKKITLKPLLESTDGVHLTAYLVNNGKLTDLRKQLREAIDQAHEYLAPVMLAEERDKFLEPFDKLVKDARLFKQMKGNIGLFRNQDSFRVLSVPVDVEQTTQVATSFHVKPLLRWLQEDQEFLLLGLEQEAAHLYLGSKDSLRLVDSILFPDSDYLSLKKAGLQKAKKTETFTWINEWISELTRVSKPKLFLAGEQSLVERMNISLKYKNSVKTPAANYFSKGNVGEISDGIRKLLKIESQKTIEKTLMEFRFAEEGNRTRKNIFQISKAVVKGKVRKLIVSDELSIFGKIDKKSGGLAIHPCDLDHEDDDILDDLAQMVLSQGGEVVVASKEEIPKGRPILAILDDESKELEKAKEIHQNEVLQARFG